MPINDVIRAQSISVFGGGGVMLMRKPTGSKYYRGHRIFPRQQASRDERMLFLLFSINQSKTNYDIHRPRNNLKTCQTG